MEDYSRSKSYGENGRMEMERYEDMRSYSASSASTQQTQNQIQLKKGKSANESILKAAWCLSDPELQRKKRVASYKSFTVEGKIKRSFSKSFRWIKDRCSNLTNDS